MHRFLAKPCEPEVLMETITRPLNLYAHNSQQPVYAAISLASKTSALLTFTGNLWKKQQAFRFDQDHFGIIDRDVGLFATISKLTNSDYFSLPTHHNTRKAVQFWVGHNTLIIVVPCLKHRSQRIICPSIENLVMKHWHSTIRIAGCEGSSQAKLMNAFAQAS